MIGIEVEERLDRLTGIRRKRLRDGLWVSAEGVIYEEFDEDIHVVHRDAGEFKYWLMCADEGFANPACVLLVGVDADWRLHVVREFYKSGHRHSQIARAAIDAAEGCTGGVSDGIDTVKELLVPQDDDKPRLTVAPECVYTIKEFQSYVWATTRTGEKKEEPKKVNDHAMDSIRYLTNWLFAEQIFVREANNTVSTGNW
jgi:phage terminase large subunit